MSVLMLLLHSPRPDRASTASRYPGSPRPRLPPGSGMLRPGRPERPGRVWPGRTGQSRPWGRAPAPPPPPGTTGSPSHADTPEPEPPPKPTHQPPHAPPHHDAHPDQPQSQTQNTPPTSRCIHHQTPPTVFLSPHARDVPGRDEMSPTASFAPAGSRGEGARGGWWGPRQSSTCASSRAKASWLVCEDRTKRMSSRRPTASGSVRERCSTARARATAISATLAIGQP